MRSESISAIFKATASEMRRTGAIAGHDDGAILDAGHGVEEGVYLFWD